MKPGLAQLHAAPAIRVPEAAPIAPGFAWPMGPDQAEARSGAAASSSPDLAPIRIAPVGPRDESDVVSQTCRSIFERGGPKPRSDRSAAQTSQSRSDGPSRDARNVAAVFGVVGAVENLEAEADASEGREEAAARLSATAPRVLLPDASGRARAPASAHETRPVSTAPPSAPVATVARMEMSATPGGSSARVEIRHPTLGTIGLDIRIEDDRMIVFATTRSSAAACAVASGLDSLRHSLRRSGLVLADFRTRVARPSDDEWLTDEEDAP